jgi:hypothetical protein
VAWAIEQQDVTEPVTRLVLICLANYAGSDGNAAYPSLLRLARDSGLSERAIRIHLRKLEAAALIRRGNQAFAAAQIERADRRPTVYNLVISRGASDAPRPSTGGTGERNGGHVVPPIRRIYPKENLRASITTFQRQEKEPERRSGSWRRRCGCRRSH